jgi:hypothetical protein
MLRLPKKIYNKIKIKRRTRDAFTKGGVKLRKYIYCDCWE